MRQVSQIKHVSVFYASHSYITIIDKFSTSSHSMQGTRRRSFMITDYWDEWHAKFSLKVQMIPLWRPVDKIDRPEIDGLRRCSVTLT